MDKSNAQKRKENVIQFVRAVSLYGTLLIANSNCVNIQQQCVTWCELLMINAQCSMLTVRHIDIQK